MPGDCDNPYAVCHHDVLSLTGYAETGLLKTSHRIEVVDAGNLRHGSDRNLDLSDFRTFQELPGRHEVLADRVFDICQSLFLGLTLRPAPRKARD